MKSTLLQDADALWPLIERKVAALVIAATRSTGGATAIGEHEIGGSLHKGVLRDDQGPQFLLTNGLRSVTGNLPVDEGITVDGVDISAHAADPDAHHDRATVVAPLIIADQQISLSLGFGVENSGGALRIKRPTNSGLALDSSGVYVNPYTLNTTTTDSVTNSGHTHAITTTTTGTPATIVALDANGYSQAARWVATDRVRAPLIDTASGNVTLQPAGDVILDPIGNDVLPATNYDINLGMLSKKYLTLHAAELWVETLVAQNTIATIGGRILVGPTTTLTRDLATGDTTIYVKHNQMVSGDRVYMEADGKVEFFAITSGATNTGSDYSYTVTRNLDGSGANQWYAGDAMFNTGQSGNGFIDLYSIRGVKTSSQAGPTIVGNVRNSSTFNDWSEAWAIGNLNGLYGYGTNLMGVGLGKYASGHPNVVIDPTNGVRLRQYNTDMIVLDPAGNSYFAGVMTIGTSGEIRQGTGTLGSNYTGLRIWRDTNVGRIAGYNNNVLQWYCGTDGKIYAGTGLIWLDTVGVNLTPYTSHDDDATTIQWKHASHLPAKLWAKMDTAANTCGMVVEIPASGINLNQALVIKAKVPSGFSSIYQVWHAGNDGAGSGLDADLLDGMTTSASGNRWGVIPYVASDGVTEIGSYLDFHASDGDTGDYAFRLYTSSGFLRATGGIIPDVDNGANLGATTNKWQTVYSYNVIAKYGEFAGTNWTSHINYGTDETMYLRAGKTGSVVTINDAHNGNVQLVVGGGAVLINATTNPYSAKLHVAGNIHAAGVLTSEDYLQTKERSGAPASASGWVRIYADSADGDLKVIFGNGTVKTIQTN